MRLLNSDTKVQLLYKRITQVQKHEIITEIQKYSSSTTQSFVNSGT